MYSWKDLQMELLEEFLEETPWFDGLGQLTPIYNYEMLNLNLRC